MPVGCEVYDPVSGSLIWSQDSQLCHWIGSVAVNGASAGSVSHASLAEGTPFWFLYGGTGDMAGPTVTVSGTTISWTAAVNPSWGSGTLFYGWFS